MGAAIAAGSHALNGTCALLVKVATTRTNKAPNCGATLEAENSDKEKSPDVISKTKETKIRASPSRFVRAVIIPALKDLLLL